MPWPLSQDYNEAIQSPELCFADADLRQAEAQCNAIGLPMPRSGNFADVYELTGPGGKKWALKCFTRQVANLRERYAAISACLKQAQLKFTVDFTYLEQGVKVQGAWYPALKMDWVEGLTLNEFVKQHADNPQYLDLLSQLWQRLARRLREAQMAHADLQHGNVLLVPGNKAASLSVKLIDYDGMFVPALADKKSGEVGHPAFQHPQRIREAIYSAEVDRFPHLVIYTALRALKAGGRYLWNKYDNGDNLLFRQDDLNEPNKSPLFQELLAWKDPELGRLAQILVQSARQRLDQVPLLDEVVSGKYVVTAALPEPAAPAPRATVAKPATPPAPVVPISAPPRPRSRLRAVLISVVGILVLLGSGTFWAVKNGVLSPRQQTVVAPEEPANSDPQPVAFVKDPSPPAPPSKDPGPIVPPNKAPDPVPPKKDPDPIPPPKKDPDPTPPRKDPDPIPPPRKDPDPIPAPKKDPDPIPPPRKDPDPAPPNLPKVYLAQMIEFDVKRGPWPFGKGTTGQYGEWRIRIPGLDSPNGLSMYPPERGSASVKYRLSTGAQTFQAKVALTGQAKAVAESPVTFQVWGDGKRLWESRPMQDRGPAQECTIKVVGVDVLELRVNCAGGNRDAAAVWLEPHLLVNLQPVPAQAALTMADRKIKDLFKADFAKRQTSEQLTAFAERLLQQGTDTRNDPAARFVLWREARELYAQAAEPAKAFRTVRLMSQEFAIDPLAGKVRALETASAAAPALDRCAPVVSSGVVLLSEAVSGDDYAAANRIIKAVETIVNRARNAALVAIVQARKKEVETFQREYARLKDVVLVLEREPHDPAANHALGKFYCLVKGDWVKGLPLLEKGSEARFAALARQDLANTSDAAAQAAKGDAWRQFAREPGTASPARERLEERARYWYGRALPRLTGLPQTELANQMKQTAGKLELSPGLVAEYFQGTNFDRRRKVRLDYQVLFAWGMNKPDPAVDQENFTVRWVGWLKAPQPGIYTLTTISDDGAIVRLDNKPIISQWDATKTAGRLSAVVQLTDKPHLLEILFVQGKGAAMMRLFWTQNGVFPITPVPADALAHDPQQQAISNFNYAPYAGKWTVRYTNKAVREYVIDSNGGVQYTQEKRSGSLVLGANRELLLTLRGIERVRLVNGQPHFDHFKNWNDYLAGKLNTVGIGTKK